MPWSFVILLHHSFFTLYPLDILVVMTLIKLRMVHGEEKVMPGTDMGHRLYFYSCVSLFCFIILELNLSKTLLAVNKTKAHLAFPSGITFLDQRKPTVDADKEMDGNSKDFQ